MLVFMSAREHEDLAEPSAELPSMWVRLGSLAGFQKEQGKSLVLLLGQRRQPEPQQDPSARPSWGAFGVRDTSGCQALEL
jgi:hypothetical protein